MHAPIDFVLIFLIYHTFTIFFVACVIPFISKRTLKLSKLASKDLRKMFQFVSIPFLQLERSYQFGPLNRVCMHASCFHGHTFQSSKFRWWFVVGVGGGGGGGGRWIDDRPQLLGIKNGRQFILSISLCENPVDLLIVSIHRKLYDQFSSDTI